MAIIPQRKLFEWNEIQELGDLERLRLVLEHMPDEELMVALERKRGKSRDDYPIRAMWNSVLAGIVFQHESVEKLRRELARNGQLREMCGFNSNVPGPWCYTRFLKSLMDQETLIEAMFDQLVKQICGVLPDFGKHLAMDSKALCSFAKRKNKNEARDGRRNTDADYGKKAYRGRRGWDALGKDRQVVRLQAAPHRRRDIRAAGGIPGDEGVDIGHYGRACLAGANGTQAAGDDENDGDAGGGSRV